MDLLRNLLSTAVASGASDILIRADRHPVVRIGGDLVDVDSPPTSAEWLGSICHQLVPAPLREKIDSAPELDYSFHLDGVGRFRAALFTQRGSRSLVLRHVRTRVPDLETLGLPSILGQLAGLHDGILIVAGPTGCGKSTTLAAAIGRMNRTERRHIITLEDPIEYLFNDDRSVIEQREIGIDTPSYADALRAVLRQDPDVIMIGEMRDSLSLGTALRAAETGHLVLTTLHTTTAAHSIGRILDFHPPADHPQILRQLSDTLRAVICQRLVRTKQDGLTPAVEVLVNTPAVRKVLREGELQKIDDAIESGAADGMQSLNRALADLVKQQKVTPEEAMANATNPLALRMTLKGISVREGSRILG